MTEEITNEIKKAIIENEIALHKNTAYLVQLRHSINKKLGATAEELKPLVDELVKHEQTIDLLKEELKEVDK
jgi:hypothetical protein